MKMFFGKMLIYWVILCLFMVMIFLIIVILGYKTSSDQCGGCACLFILGFMCTLIGCSMIGIIK
jgi:hypothetical protein